MDMPTKSGDDVGVSGTTPDCTVGPPFCVFDPS